MSTIQSLEPASRIHINMSVEKNNRESDKLLFLVLEMNFKSRVKWLTRGRLTWRRPGCRPPCLSITPLAAAAARVLEGRNRLHARWQSRTPGFSSSGVAALLPILSQIPVPAAGAGQGGAGAGPPVGPPHLRCFLSCMVCCVTVQVITIVTVFVILISLVTSTGK